MNAVTVRNLTMTAQLALCALVIWISLLIYSELHSRQQPGAALQALVANLDNCQLVLSAQHDSAELLIARLRNAHQRFIQQASQLEHGDHTGQARALPQQWQEQIRQISANGKQWFSDVHQLASAYELQHRHAAKRAAHERHLLTLSDSLTRLFNTELSVDLNPLQMRQIYLIHYHLHGLAGLTQQSGHAEVNVRDTSDVQAILESFDTLLQGQHLVANLALRRHLANLRIRFAEQVATFETLQQEITANSEHSSGQHIDAIQQSMLANIQGLFSQAAQLTDAFHGEQHTHLLGFAILLMAVFLTAGALPWITTNHSASKPAGYAPELSYR